MGGLAGGLADNGGQSGSVTNVSTAVIAIPVPTGVAATDTANVQAAIAAGLAAGAATLEFAAGTYVINATLTMYSSMRWLGAGKGITFLQAANGLNADLIQTYQFATLTGTSTGPAPNNWSLEHLTLSGNFANNSAGNGISSYAYRPTYEQVEISGFAGLGIYQEWRSTAGFSSNNLVGNDMHGRMVGCDIHDNQGGGVDWFGPSDSNMISCDIYRNGPTSNSTTIGLRVRGNATSFRANHCHVWGTQHNTGVSAEAAGLQLHQTDLEGALTAQLLCLSNSGVMKGGKIFTPGANYIGIQVGQNGGGGSAIGGWEFDTYLSNCNVNLGHDGGGHTFKLHVFGSDATKQAITGTMTTLDGSVYQVFCDGGIQLGTWNFSSAGLTPVLASPLTTARYWVGGTGTWDQSTTTHWAATSGGAGGASVPTAANDVIFDGNSGAGTCTVSASAPCNSLSSAGSSLTTLVQNISVVLTIGGTSNAGPGNVALDLSGFSTYTKGGSGSSAITFVSTVPIQQTVKYGASNTVGNQTFNGVGGSWKLLGAMTETSATSSQLTLTAGSLELNGQTVSMSAVSITGATTRALTNSGTSTITLDGAFAGAWTAATTTGLTFSCPTTTITLTGAAGAGTQLFRAGGLTYGTVNITGTGTAIVTGGGTFTTFSRSNAVACGLQFVHGTTVTVTTAAGWSVSGTSGNLITVNSDLAANAWTLSCVSGTVNSNFLSLQDSAAAGGATFHAGAGSTNVSGNSGWLFP